MCKKAQEMGKYIRWKECHRKNIMKLRQNEMRDCRVQMKCGTAERDMPKTCFIAASSSAASPPDIAWPRTISVKVVTPDFSRCAGQLLVDASASIFRNLQQFPFSEVQMVTYTMSLYVSASWACLSFASLGVATGSRVSGKPTTRAPDEA